MWPDEETEIDYLNFGYMVDLLVDIATNRELPPSTIRVYGDWGSGKYSLMKLVRKKIEIKNSKISLCGAILDALFDTMLDIERIVSSGVVCMYNAWSHYRPTTIVSSSFCMAIERKRKVVIPPTFPITLCYWKEESLSLGVTETVLSEHTVRITNLERSVCDEKP